MLKKIMLSVCIGLSLLCIAGCSKNKKPEFGTYTYSELDEALLYNDISHIKVYGDDIYFIAEKNPDIPDEFIEESNRLRKDAPDNYAELKTALYDKYELKIKAGIWKYNKKSGEKKPVYEREYYDNEVFDEYCVNEDGTFAVFFSKYNPEADIDDGAYGFTKAVGSVAADGTEISWQTMEEYMGGKEYSDSDIDIDSYGNIYGVKTNDNHEIEYLFKLNPDKELIGKIEWNINATMAGSSIDDNGDMLIKCSNSELGYEYMTASFDDGKLEPAGEFINTMTGEADNDNKAEEAKERCDYSILGCAGGDSYLLKDNTYMYIYDMSDNTLTPLLKWMDCGIVGGHVQSAVSAGDDSYLCGMLGDDGTIYDRMTTAVILKKSDEDEKEKKVLTLTGLENNDIIRQEIVEFNKKSDKYKIEYRTYDNKSDPAYALTLDITAGKAPDIIDVSSVDKNMFIAAGVLCDLTPFMEKDDILNKDYFVPGLLDSTAVEGKQYYLLRNFTLTSMAGHEKALNKYKDNWNINSFMEYCDAAPENTKAIDFDYKNNIFFTILKESIDSYIDWNTGEVFFDGEEFRKFMEFCNSFPDEGDADFTLNGNKAFGSGDLLFMEDYIFCMDNILLRNAASKGNYTYIGYPDKAGGFSHMMPGDGGIFAISAASEQKDGAWEFIKQVITDEYDDSDSFPASNEEFEKMLKRYTAAEKYMDETGQTVRPISDEYEDQDGTVYDICPATEKDVSELRYMIKHSKIIVPYDENKGYGIVYEEAEKYFSGEKSINETISVIQDRMKKYVNENR